MHNKKAILYLTGGLGNQLFQYAFGISQSQDKEVFIETQLGWPVLANDSFPTIYEYQLSTSTQIKKMSRLSGIARKIGFFAVKLSSTKNIYYRSVLRFFSLPMLSLIFSIYYKQCLRIQLSKGVGYAPIAKSNANSFIVGYFQSFYWPSLEEVRPQLLQLSLKKSSAELIRYEQLAQMEKPLIVHIRLGDYLAEKSFGIPSKDYYERAISELFNFEKDRKIWIFTNDQALAESFIPSKYESHLRWIPNVEESAAVTLEVMRLGTAYVIGNSTYSWWGAFLSRNQDALVIAPIPWFKDGPEPAGICPGHWKRREAWP